MTRALSRAGLALALVTSSPSAVAAQGDTLWRYTSATRIAFSDIDVAGHFLVGSTAALVALHPDSGAVVWTYPVTGEIRVLRTTMLSHLLVGYDSVLAALHTVTGDTVWHRTDLPTFEKTSLGSSREDPYGVLQTRSGFAVLDLNTGATRWDSTAFPPGTVVREYFRLREENLLLLLARTPASEASLLGVTLDSGRVLWQHDSLFRRPPRFKRERGVEYITDYQSLFILPDTTLLVYLSEDGPMRLEPRTGAILWRAEQLAGPVPARTEGYPRVAILDSAVLVPTERGVAALDLATGRERWRTTRDFRDKPSGLVPDSGAVLVGGVGRQKPFLAALDPATGARLWARDIELKAEARVYILGDTVFVCNDGWFSAVPVAAGVPRHLAEIRFEGGEQPARIDTIEGGGFVLAASQNLMRVAPDGQVAYRRYFKAPGASFLAKLASTALIVGLNVASVAATPSGGMAPVIVSNPVLSARYARASEAQNYFYVFTEAPDTLGQKGFYLLLVDRRDGTELGRLRFDERSPDYRLDHLSGTVYEREGDTLIIARRFPAR